MTKSSVTMREEFKSSVIYVEKNWGLFNSHSATLFGLWLLSPPRGPFMTGFLFGSFSFQVSTVWPAINSSQKAFMLATPQITIEAPALNFLLCVFQILKSVDFWNFLWSSQALILMVTKGWLDQFPQGMTSLFGRIVHPQIMAGTRKYFYSCVPHSLFSFE